MKPWDMMRRMAGGGGGGSASYLDALAATPVAAYGLKKLISTATSAIRVRRSSDNAEQDIGFVGDALDTSSLLAFVGSNSGFVAKMYDQVGANHWLQATADNQPRIVNAGSYDGECVFDGINDAFASTSAYAFGTQRVGIYTNLRTPTTGGKILWEASTNFNDTANNNAFIGYYDSSDGGLLVGARQGPGGYRVNAFAIAAGVRKTLEVLYDRSLTGTDEIKCWQDGAAMTPTAKYTLDATSNFASYAMYIGARSGSSFQSDMGLATFAIYTDDTSAIHNSIRAIIA